VVELDYLVEMRCDNCVLSNVVSVKSE